MTVVVPFWSPTCIFCLQMPLWRKKSTLKLLLITDRMSGLELTELYRDLKQAGHGLPSNSPLITNCESELSELIRQIDLMFRLVSVLTDFRRLNSLPSRAYVREFNQPIKLFWYVFSLEIPFMDIFLIYRYVHKIIWGRLNNWVHLWVLILQMEVE